MARTKRRGNASGGNRIQTQSRCAVEQHKLSASKPLNPSSIALNYAGEGNAIQTQSYGGLEHQPCASKPSFPSNGFSNPGGIGVSSTTNTRDRKRTRDFTSASNVIQTRSRGAIDQQQSSASKPLDPSNGAPDSGCLSLIITKKGQKRARETLPDSDFMQIQSHGTLERHEPSASKPSDSTNGAPSFGGTGVSFLSNTRKCRSTRRGGKRTLDDAFTDPSSLNYMRKDLEKSIHNSCELNVIRTQPHCALEQHQHSTLKPTDPLNCARVSTETGLRIKLKKGRGPAKGSDDWGSGGKLQLEFNEFMEPIGANKDKFMSQLGIIARNGQKVPLTYTSWSEVPSEVLNSLWREVQENTNVPLEYCANCLKSIGKLWRNWKHLVKANHYLAHETDEERLSYVPPRVIDDQWKTLVKYWGSEQAQNITNRNKANRELQGLPHRTGRKGFSDIRFKMLQEGENTDRVSLWVKTRTPSFGTQHDPVATEGNSMAQKRASGNTSMSDAIQTESHFTMEQLQPSMLQPSDPSCSAPNSGGAGRSFLPNTRKVPSMRKGRKSTFNSTSLGNGIQMQTHCTLSQQQLSLSNSSDSSNADPNFSGTDTSSLNDERIRLNEILDDASMVNVIERQIQYGLEQHQPSTSMPSDPSNNAANPIEIGARIKKRKGRGPAKGFDEWGSGEKLYVDFNEFMQPVGVNKDKFMSQIGMIARNGQKLSLTYKSWKKVPPEVLDSIWSEVQENSNAPLEYRANCLKAIGRLWRNWKHLVKSKHYLVHDTDEKRLSYVPPRVIDDQWKALVEYWGSEKAQNVTDRNKKNRELQAMPHRTGRKGFSEIRFQMQQEGESTDTVSVWMKTRTPKGGSQLDPKTKEVISKLNDRLSQVPELEQTPELREEIFIDIMGSDGHGRVRSFAAGPSRKEMNIQASKVPMYEMLVKVRTEMQQQATVREKKMQEEFVAAQSQMQAQLDMMRSCLEKAGIKMPPGGMQVPNASRVHETPTHSSA